MKKVINRQVLEQSHMCCNCDKNQEVIKSFKILILSHEKKEQK